MDMGRRGCNDSDEDEEQGHVHWNSRSYRGHRVAPRVLDICELPKTIQVLEVLDMMDLETGIASYHIGGRRLVYVRKEGGELQLSRDYMEPSTVSIPDAVTKTPLNFWNPTHNFFSNDDMIDERQGPSTVVKVVEGNHWRGIQDTAR